MKQSPGRDNWSNAVALESYVGRWSRSVARQFLQWLAVPEEKNWLDAGCGTGALAQAILENVNPSSVSGIDLSEEYVAFARSHVKDARAKFECGNVVSLPYPDATFDAVVSGLVLNFLPDPQKMIAEMKRVVKPAGTIAVYVWDYAGGMELIRYFWDAAVEVDPSAEQFDEGERFPVCKPEPLQKLFRSAGLKEVEVHDVDVPTDFKDFIDFWTPFLGGRGPAPGYTMSLSAEQREMLREKILESLPIEGDGSIHLMARAWAVRGTRAM